MDVEEEELMKGFIDAMRGSLRQSDVLTRYGKSQVLLILLKATSIDIEVVTERILMNWDANELSDHCHITFEVDTLR